MVPRCEAAVGATVGLTWLALFDIIEAQLNCQNANLKTKQACQNSNEYLFSNGQTAGLTKKAVRCTPLMTAASSHSLCVSSPTAGGIVLQLQ